MTSKGDRKIEREERKRRDGEKNGKEKARWRGKGDRKRSEKIPVSCRATASTRCAAISTHAMNLKGEAID